MIRRLEESREEKIPREFVKEIIYMMPGGHLTDSGTVVLEVKIARCCEQVELIYDLVQKHKDSEKIVAVSMPYFGRKDRVESLNKNPDATDFSEIVIIAGEDKERLLRNELDKIYYNVKHLPWGDIITEGIGKGLAVIVLEVQRSVKEKKNVPLEEIIDIYLKYEGYRIFTLQWKENGKGGHTYTLIEENPVTELEKKLNTGTGYNAAIETAL